MRKKRSKGGGAVGSEESARALMASSKFSSPANASLNWDGSWPRFSILARLPMSGAGALDISCGSLKLPLPVAGSSRSLQGLSFW